MAALLLLLAGTGVTSPAVAQTVASEEVGASGTSEVRWEDGWTRCGLVDYLATAGLGLTIVGLHLGLEPPGEPRATGGVWLDDEVRGALRNGDADTRFAMRRVSDVLLFALLAWPYADGGVAWALHGDSEVALELFAMNTQAFALTYLATNLTKHLVRRERPYGTTCGDDPDGAEDGCNSPDRYLSFVSGHTSVSFTAAGLVCAHHQNLGLYGGGAGDTAACVTALGAATAVGLLRMTSDRHYLTDVAVGGALGLVSGYLLPSLLHYDLAGSDEDADRRGGGTLSLIGGPGSIGLGYHRVWY